MILYIIFPAFQYLIIDKDSNDNVQTTQLTVGLIVGLWTYAQFFKSRQIIANVLRVALSYFIYFSLLNTLLTFSPHC